MAELIKPQKAVSAAEALKTEILINQALINILIAKQVISESELLNCIQKIRREEEKRLDWLF